MTHTTQKSFFFKNFLTKKGDF